jgi:hypothetical protein
MPVYDGNLFDPPAPLAKGSVVGQRPLIYPCFWYILKP